MTRYKDLPSAVGHEYYDDPDKRENAGFAKQALLDANTPYMPQGCSKVLAQRIFDAAKKVRLFSTVHHLTSASSLSKILDDSLYGRRTLLQRYLPFKPAALSTSDLLYGGDANVICFGPFDVDPNAVQKDAIDIVFDLEKIKNNPCIFYKQKDLGYDPKNYKRVDVLKSQMPLFSHTKHFLHTQEGFTAFQVFNKNGGVIAVSQLPNYQMIAYDVENMHQILTLNFFRFLDTLYPYGDNETPHEELVENMYASIEKLNDAELQKFLQELGEKMTDTAEFNFYGAYRIDFAVIKTISAKQRVDQEDDSTPIIKTLYTLNLPIFIQKLAMGDMKALTEAKEKIPTLFQSYRFLDYLLSRIPREASNEALKKELHGMREQITALPHWMKEMHKKREKLEPQKPAAPTKNKKS